MTKSAIANGDFASEYVFSVSTTPSFFVDRFSASNISLSHFSSLALANVPEVVVETYAISSASTIARIGFPSCQRKYVFCPVALSVT